MKSYFLATVTLVLFLSPAQDLIGQSPEMPMPLMVLKDGDGKVISQIADMKLGGSSGSFWIILDIDGVPAPFEVELSTSRFINKYVYFSADGCTGTPHINEPASGAHWLEKHIMQSFSVVGPDQDTGTYRVFRSTSPNPVSAYPESWWNSGRCDDLDGSHRELAPAEEVLPNPMEGFHGPAISHSGRKFTVTGGTRLP